MSGPTRRDVAVAGHQGDLDTATAGLASDDGNIRATALGALERLGALADEQLITAFSDDDPRVRRRAAELAATHPAVDLVPLLADPDVNVVEMAAWTRENMNQIDLQCSTGCWNWPRTPRSRSYVRHPSPRWAQSVIQPPST